ncbi:hypothetical protein TURU_109387 [Turdus rufiventris]|nr:hypothetical protein TURU_109387 [Turdus rufiventris]
MLEEEHSGKHSLMGSGGSWEPEKAQGSCKDDMPSKEEKGGNTEEEDRDVMGSHEPQEVTEVREEVNLLLAEQCRMVA